MVERGQAEREPGADECRVMGTRDEAEAKLIAAWLKWCEYQGAFVGTAKEHRQRDAVGREMANRFVQAAATLAWHLHYGPPSQAIIDALSPGASHG